MNEPASFWMFVMLGAFNLSGFILLWVEIHGHNRKQHRLREQMTNLYSGGTLTLLDHERRIAMIEGAPFRPEKIYDSGGEHLKELVAEYIKEHGYPSFKEK